MTDTPSKDKDPRYTPGISQHDDDMSDQEWIDAYGELRSVIFIADPDAPGFMVKQTVADLIARQRFNHAIIDPATRAGIQAGLAVLDAGIPYRLAAMLTESEENELTTLSDDELEDKRRVGAGAYGEQVLDRTDIGLEDNLPVLFPRVIHGQGPQLGMSPDRIVGATLALMKNGQRECMVVCPPEMGMVPINGRPGAQYLLQTLIMRD